MKKMIIVFTILVLCLALILGACAKEEAPAPAPAPTPKPAPAPAPKPAPAPAPKPARIPFDQQELQKFVVAHATPGGTTIVLCSALGGMISKYTDMTGSVTTLPGFGSAIEYFREGEIDYSSLTEPSPYDAYTGAKVDKLRLRWWWGTDGSSHSAYIFVTLPESDVKSGADFKGKKIAYIPGWAWALVSIESVLEANGISKDDVTLMAVGGSTEAVNLVKEKRADLCLTVGGAATVEMSQTTGIFVIPLTEAETDLIVEKMPTVHAGNYQKGYQGIDESKWGIHGLQGFFGRADMNEKTMYTIADMFFSNKEEFNRAHQLGKVFRVDTATKLIWSMPYHPGVVRYYQDQGVWTSEDTEKQRKMLEIEKELYGSLLESDVEAFTELGILP